MPSYELWVQDGRAKWKRRSRWYSAQGLFLLFAPKSLISLAIPLGPGKSIFLPRHSSCVLFFYYIFSSGQGKGRRPELSYILTWFVIQMLLITSKMNLTHRNLKRKFWSKAKKKGSELRPKTLIFCSLDPPSQATHPLQTKVILESPPGSQAP